MQPEHHNDIDKRLSCLYAAPVPESFETGWRADIHREESMQTMNKINWNGMWKRIAPVLCALVLVLGGLWAGTLDQDGMLQGSDTAYTMVTSRSTSGSTASNAMSAKYSLMASEEAAYDTAAGYDYGVTTYGAVPQEDRKLVRTASLTVRTDAFDEALEQVENAINAVEGYIENLYQYGENVRRLNLSIRVPSARLDEFLKSLEGAGRVTDRSETTTDMTVQYTDNAARLKTLYEKRDRLNELLVKAEDVKDLIEIESAIADTQYQIESYESTQRSIDHQVDMSEVSMTLVEEEQAADNPELTLVQRIKAGFSASVNGLEELGRNIIVFVVMAAPVAVPLAVLWIVCRIVRKMRRNGK